MTQNVLLPVDPDEKASWERALPIAVEEAKQRNATLHVLTVVPSFGSSIVASYFPKDFSEKATSDAERQLDALIKSEVPAGIKTERHVAHGRIHQEIVRVAKGINVDLIVMASHKPDWSDSFLTPNAAQVLHHAPMSVLVVR
ncbi:MAG: universal stress protein [Pseudomonadota bacterium]